MPRVSLGVGCIRGYAVMRTPATRGAVVRLSLPAPGPDGPSTVPRTYPGPELVDGGGGGAPLLSLPSAGSKPSRGEGSTPSGFSAHASARLEKATSAKANRRDIRVPDTESPVIV